MQERKIKKLVQGVPTVDGAGVRLTRVLGNWTMYDFDPFLMLDSFDSRDPADYVAGFPWHPHRGIETITYLVSGEIEHADSLGNQGVIRSGEAQWMTAGSGVMHSEMPRAAERLLGVQLWLNLPAKDKMATPDYLGITAADIGVLRFASGTIRVLSGEYRGVAGALPKHIPARILDVELRPGASVEIGVPKGHTAFVFLLQGSGMVAGEHVATKNAALLTDGESVVLQDTPGAPARMLVCSAEPLGEGIAWGGPIVMNTDEELREAFEELDAGTFVREAPHTTSGLAPGADPRLAAESKEIPQPSVEEQAGYMPEPPVELGEKLL